MAPYIIKALDTRISELESQLKALRQARQALSGVGKPATAKPTRKRRKLTAKEKAAISKRMKASWAKRKAGKK